MQTLYFINGVIGMLFLICYSYQFFYIAVALVKRPKPYEKEAVLHNFAVLIPARNEEAVIGELITSINEQDYPSDRITVFVVADNCTDGTAEAARKCGAVVYERFNKELVGKGYALNYLLEKIENDFDREAFDAFFVFDADNVLTPNYVTEMNKAYSEGFRALTSYRNSKNYGDNWISSGYALWFIREAKYLNNSRMILKTSCAVSGTGFLVDRKLFENKEGHLEWNYFLLTEDIEFTASSVVNGERIGYCGTAEFFDEQPVKFRQSWNQRLRWAKGYLQVFANYGKRLITGIFKKNERTETYHGGPFACFDMSMTIMPAMILSGIMLTLDIAASIVMAFKGEFFHALNLIVIPLADAYGIVFVVGIITAITEWSHIHTTVPRKILSIFTFPLFMITYIPISYAAILKRRVGWDPIRHSKAVSLKEIESNGSAEK